MRSGCRPQSELAPLLKDLLRVTPSRLVVVAIVARVQPRASEGHADLASSSPSSPVRGQSRLILITGNEGCVRYPTEGNDSCHELTTVSSPLLLMARTILSFPLSSPPARALRLKPALLSSHLSANQIRWSLYGIGIHISGTSAKLVNYLLKLLCISPRNIQAPLSCCFVIIDRCI